MKRPKNREEYIPSSADLDMADFTTQLFGSYALDRLPWFLHPETHEIMRINNIYDNEIWVLTPNCLVEEQNANEKGLKLIEPKEFIMLIKNNQLVETDKETYCNEYLYHYKDFNNSELSLSDFYSCFFQIANKLKVIPRLSYKEDVIDVYRIIKSKLS